MTDGSNNLVFNFFFFFFPCMRLKEFLQHSQTKFLHISILVHILSSLAVYFVTSNQGTHHRCACRDTIVCTICSRIDIAHRLFYCHRWSRCDALSSVAPRHLVNIVLFPKGFMGIGRVSCMPLPRFLPIR